MLLPRLAALPLALLALGNAHAQPNVSLQGSLGSKAALLMIDGEARTLTLGQTVRGVRLLSLEEGRALVEIEGRRVSLQMGAAQVRLGDGAAAANSGRQIVLSSGPGGHFTSVGSINGKSTQFLVDTGATSVAISQAEAEHMGLKYRDGRRVLTQTANGAAPAHVVTLNTVRIGDVEVRNVEAIVIPAQMSHVLLGNSFLSRFQMKRENDVLTLDLRF
ncbi:retropepsin-like aspartic protease [Paucibacter sediminis]|uniref:Retropepsin-like aspartic protease n=1 Tax=Paucibacter sediminis TaxID=3019553 RepID=A0AA95SK46_9BURK|nr:retropepsin-like aspartic protease [Paucibacter sp. S2-9]WIT10688.1 retropepsin-like aspartic protease [Paucibacter sp. S2-9]